MNRGLLTKAFLEIWLTTVLCGLGLALFEGLVAYFFWSYQDLLTQEMMSIPIVRDLMESLIGSELGDQLSPMALSSLAWAHPLVLALLWTHVISICTRVPAGEIDRGTVDVLLGLPVSRWKLYLNETVAWLLAGGIVLDLALAGNVIGHLFIPEADRPLLINKIYVALNLYGIYIAVGGLTCLVASVSDRRGRAVGVVVGIVVVQFVWNFLGQYWELASDWSFLSILDYHKPMAVLDEGIFPAMDLVVLFAVGLVPWILGGILFTRRDVRTV